MQVLYDGKPVSEGEVQFVDPGGRTSRSEDRRPRACGASPPAAALGPCGPRRSKPTRVASATARSSSNTWHYATLTFDVPGTAADRRRRLATAGESALELLVRARDGRAMWNEFPGFTTDLTVLSGDETLRGQGHDRRRWRGDARHAQERSSPIGSRSSSTRWCSTACRTAK